MELESKETDYVIHACGTVDAGTFQAEHVVSGSVVLRCQQCGTRVWASPASCASVAAECDRTGLQRKVICFSCALPYLRSGKNQTMPPTAGQLAEIRTELSK